MRGLHLPEPAARRGGGDGAVFVGDLDRVLLGNGDDRRALGAHDVDQLLDGIAPDERARCVMDEHDIRLLGDERKPVADGVLPLRSALDDAPRGEPLDASEKARHGLDLIRADGDDELADVRHFGKREQRAQEHRLTGEGQKNFVQPDLHPMRLPRRRENHTNHVSSFQRRCQRVTLAKIMRPAAVWSADVTSTETISFMQRNPPSTTIIVPSSRYASPCPCSLPGRTI